MLVQALPQPRARRDLANVQGRLEVAVLAMVFDRLEIALAET
jgi:hypothetical protein